MSSAANQHVRDEREDVARGIRLLLGTPLLTSARSPDGFTVVRRRRGPIGDWFEYYCGWQLVVEPRAGYARLVKVRSEPDPSRPARRARSTRAPFDRRRYVLFCVVAAELMGGPVTTIGLLADRVAAACAADAALPPFDPAIRAERMAYVDALKHLEQLGVVSAVDGVTDAYVRSEDAKVLYRVDATRLVGLLAAPTAPSRVLPAPAEGGVEGGVAGGVEVGVGVEVDRLIAGMLVEPRYGDAAAAAPTVSDARRNLWLRHSVIRRLVDDPVVYRSELTEAQLAYLATTTGRAQVRRAAELAGFELEERAEGYLLVDPDGLATDSRFPDDTSNAKIAALTLLDALRAAPAGLTPEQLTVEAGRMLARLPSWGRAYRSDDGARRLAADALAELRMFGLAAVDGDHGDHPGGSALVRALPAAERYRVHHEDRSRLDIPPPRHAGDGPGEEIES
ncbi:TIGR02678 family protein [Frankia sp. EI5c]|uniref:TIGR02678 family protein n=1 Tax=Frankia sp. EI5c TaxID=683316 RepID=UPI0007C20A0C|nr:TIGR02678 family protein [Frankia sp. EI5c]OAA27488.1 TIGR02678 family protein [Frankia sp. EI5c]